MAGKRKIFSSWERKREEKKRGEKFLDEEIGSKEGFSRQKKSLEFISQVLIYK